jgi:hypothetical protein
VIVLSKHAQTPPVVRLYLEVALKFRFLSLSLGVQVCNTLHIEPLLTVLENWRQIFPSLYCSAPNSRTKIHRSPKQRAKSSCAEVLSSRVPVSHY